MFNSKTHRETQNDSTLNRPPSSNSQRKEARRSKGSNDNDSTSSIVEIQEKKSVEINCDNALAIAFLADGEEIVSGDFDEKIRRWQVKDGKEMGTPINAGGPVWSIAASQDGKWLVTGSSKDVTVWHAQSHEKVTVIQAHRGAVCSVDISPDTTKIASGSDDWTVSVWSRTTGEQLFPPFRHEHEVAAVKFSPNGRLIASATSGRKSVRIYDSQDGHLLSDFPIQVTSYRNQSLAWGNGKELFALSGAGTIQCVDVYSKRVVSKWRIDNNTQPTCISLPRKTTFIAASGDSSVSFWDTTTRKQIGSIIHHPAPVYFMAISANYDLVSAGSSTITLRNFLDILPPSYCKDVFDIQRRRVEDHLKKTIDSLRAQHVIADEKIANLKNTVEELRVQLAHSQRAAKRKEEDLNKTDVIVGRLRIALYNSQQNEDRLTKILCAHRQKHQCETLYTAGHVMDAAQQLLEMVQTASDDVKSDTLLTNWLFEFTNKCICELEKIGDEASQIEGNDEGLAAYSTALYLGPSTPSALLVKWASTMLQRGSINGALSIAIKFIVPKFLTYRAICDVLEGNGRITEAIGCFRRMQSELATEASIHDERAQWELSFQRRCIKKLKESADVEVGSQNYNEAVEHLSTILSLDTADRAETLIKRSKARLMGNSWEEALEDANEVIKLDPSSYRGYEQRHAALHGAKRYAEAVEAFDAMLSKLDHSPDEHVRELRRQYIDTRPSIRGEISAMVSRMPRVLIDTITGRLHDRTQLANEFEAHPIFPELVSSMTREVDDARIREEVNKFYQYVMLSHKWESGEPCLQDVEHISVYELNESHPNTKLQTFCLVTHSLGFRWAWSDTCCVDRLNKVVLEESLVAMFAWYHGSSLTLVHLLDVLSQSNTVGLKESIWNTRAWTYQEYMAAKRVLFYTRDWQPYLGLMLSNHKESHIIISEMEQATHGSVRQPGGLKPGLDRVREKLYLASMRRATYVEDIAYSLFGIFNVAIPVIYGEGNRAVGRLLEHILTGSGDVTILAWTGAANGYNSCLPNDLTVYNELMPPHLPPFMEIADVDRIVAGLPSSIPDFSLVMKLYDQLNALPPPFLASSRLRLPAVVFLIQKVVHVSGPDPKTTMCVYRATSTFFGDVEITTTNDLTTMNHLYLVHPWISPLLDCDHDITCLPPKTTRASRLLARLMQPFGALLFEQLSRVDHRRVAADSLIMVQVSKDVSLNDLIDNIRTIDVQ